MKSTSDRKASQVNDRRPPEIVLCSTGMVSLPPVHGGAIEAYVVDVAGMLAKTNWQVCVVSGTRPQWNLPNVTIVKVRSPFDRFPLPAPMSAVAHVVGGIATAFATTRYCRMQPSHSGRLVHTNEEISAAIIGYTLPEVPQVYTLHNPPPETGSTLAGPFEAILRKVANLIVMRFVTKHTRMVVALNSNLKQYLVSEWGLREKKVFTLPLPVDTSMFTPRAESHRRLADRTNLLFVGRLDYRKGIMPLLSVLPDLDPRITLTVVGNGPLSHEVMRFIERRGLEERVQVESRISLNQLVHTYQASDLLVLPSNLEVYPRVVIEAASCGLPVVLPESPIYYDFIRGGFVQTFDHRSLASLKDCLSSLHVDTGRRKELGIRAREFALATNGLEAYVNKLQELYTEALT